MTLILSFLTSRAITVSEQWPTLKVLGVQLVHPTICKKVMVYDDIVDILLIEILFILLLASVIVAALVNTLLSGA